MKNGNNIMKKVRIKIGMIEKYLYYNMKEI